jgi:hypothetical protein
VKCSGALDRNWTVQIKRGGGLPIRSRFPASQVLRGALETIAGDASVIPGTGENVDGARNDWASSPAWVASSIACRRGGGRRLEQ